jgi:hypothetical protein
MASSVADFAQLVTLGHDLVRDIFLVWMLAVSLAVIFQAVWLVWKVHSLEEHVRHLHLIYTKQQQGGKS